MANDRIPAIETEKDRSFWRTVHTHTRHVYESLSDALIEPRGMAQEVACEALGIVHAMSHLALQSDHPLATGLCTIPIEPRHEEAATQDGIVIE